MITENTFDLLLVVLSILDITTVKIQKKINTRDNL